MKKFLILMLLSFNVFGNDFQDYYFVEYRKNPNPSIILKTFDDDKPLCYSYQKLKCKNNIIISKQQFEHLYEIYFKNYEN